MRSRLQIYLSTGTAVLLVAWPSVATPVPAAVHASARQILQQSISTVQRRRDLSGLRSMELKVRNAISHLADTDHSDSAPWIVDYEDSDWIEDLRGNRRLETSNSVRASGDKAQSMILSTPQLVQASGTENGVPDPLRADAAAPNWELANPIRSLVIAAAAPDLRLLGTAIVHQVPADVVGFTWNGFPAKLFISRESRLPMAVESLITLPGRIAWASRGDLLDRTEWMNWTLVNGIRFPTQWDTTRNGSALQTTTVLAARLDVVLDEKTLTPDPEAAAQLLLPGRKNVDDLALGDPARPISEIAHGVVQIPGDWYSTLVRQRDGIVVIDAPISNGYSAKVMAEAARRFPGVPIKAVITTTNYFWHTAGLREYAARGIPIYALDHNARVVRDLLHSPHSLAPDAYSKSSRKTALHLLAGPTMLGAGENKLLLIPVRRAFGQMLMVYFPDHRILHTAELVQPLGPGGALLFPEYLQEVTDAVHDAGIVPKTMIGMHMGPTPWSMVAEAIANADAG